MTISCCSSPQGDASPRATHKSREAKPESKPEITTTTNAPVRKRKTVNESVKAAQGSKVKGRKIQIVSKPEVEVEKEKSEGNEGANCFHNPKNTSQLTECFVYYVTQECNSWTCKQNLSLSHTGTGEWQTQLSRQQIRAQRQKKQQTAESPVPSEPISRGNEGEEEGSKVASGEKTTSYSKGGRRGKAKKQTDVSKSREPVKDTNSKGTAEATVVGMSGMCVGDWLCFMNSLASTTSCTKQSRLTKTVYYNCASLVIEPSTLKSVHFVAFDGFWNYPPATAEQTTPPTSEAGPNGEERISPPPEASKVQELTEVEKALLEAGERTHIIMHTQ